MPATPRETPGTAPRRPGRPPAPPGALLAALEAERARPDVGERVAGYTSRIDVAEALQTLIALIASVVRKERR